MNNILMGRYEILNFAQWTLCAYARVCVRGGGVQYMAVIMEGAGHNRPPRKKSRKDTKLKSLEGF